ncbi:helix-turn-helix domain-containing protein [Nocardia salmonicida]|uniref:helix-turn-helix domain-containing protein n=1 Tax=Nocardia salmonicida TaxID=53431 RepID=UPI00363E6B41
MRVAREAAGISLRAMAARTYYSKPYLSLIETGQRPVPSGVVVAYERVLGTDFERLQVVARAPASVDTAALDVLVEHRIRGGAARWSSVAVRARDRSDQ